MYKSRNKKITFNIKDVDVFCKYIEKVPINSIIEPVTFPTPSRYATLAQGTVDNNIVPDRFADPKALTSQ